MGLFHIFKPKTGPRQEPELVDILTAIDLRLKVVERELKGIDTEWTEMYDKLRRLHMRLAKRDQRGEDAPEQPNGHGDGEMSIAARRLLGRL